MLNFEYYAPTKVIFGRGTEREVGAEIKTYGCKKVLVHYGGQSALKSGLLDRVFRSLTESGIEYVALGGVVPNPRISKVREGVALCQQEKIDFILAVGGGSVIDSAKAIGYGVACNCDPWKIYTKEIVPDHCLPVGVILTIAAAGSEMSNSSVITNEEGWLKRGYNADICRPKFAIMNPELTYTLPPYQTACGCTDIMMHTMERYFTTEKHVELTDQLCEGLLRTVYRNTLKVMEQPDNYDARAEIMWAGSLSHNGLMGTGRNQDFATHQLEHELGGMFDVAHGAGLAALWGSWARYVMHQDIGRFAQFAVNVMGCVMNYEDPKETAYAGIEAMEEFYKKIGMPTSIHDMGIELTDIQIKELAEKCSFFGKRKIGQFVQLDIPDMIEIYKMAR
ncbi:MAG: iron-containing alcohol dehydrogenase [Clostridiales bacterium]|nr:iron-containing alcohol dehydrogenase [Clostridiales bacterium]